MNSSKNLILKTCIHFIYSFFFCKLH
uniref:Uncharacterized protein n=1 Tax=Arundo donax TaxID=35708 RepID=A0A0A8Y9B5_ARUDO